jgi:hypothetical protein
MLGFLGQVIEVILLAILLFFSNRYAAPLGGLFHMLISYSLRIPRLMDVAQFILQAPIYFSSVTKLIAWAISSSGLLLGLGVHYVLWGHPNHPSEWWVILVLATIAIFEIVHKSMYFDYDYSYIDALVEEMKEQDLGVIGRINQSNLNNLARYGDARTIRKLGRSVFVDQTLPQLFQLLISIGLIYYTLGALDILSLKAGSSSPNVWQSLLLSFSIIDLTGEIVSPFEGQLWNVLRMMSAFLGFFWLVLFVTLSMSSVDSASDKAFANLQAEYEARYQALREKMIAYAKATTTDLDIPKSLYKDVQN